MTDPHPTPWDRLLELRAQARVPGAEKRSDVLKELLQLLDLPSGLKGGKRIASQTCRLLRLSLRTLDGPARQQARGYLGELRWILKHADHLSREIFDNKERRRAFLRCSGGNPYVGEGATEHGFCSLAWVKHRGFALRGTERDPAISVKFDVLRCLALRAQFIAYAHWSTQPGWHSASGPGRVVRHSMYRRTLAIRHFSMHRYLQSEAYRNTLAQVPLERIESKVEAVLRQLRKNLPVFESHPESMLGRDIASILGLFRVAEDPGKLSTYTEDLCTDEEETLEVELRPGDSPPCQSDALPYTVDRLDDCRGNIPGELGEERDGKALESNPESAAYLRTRWSVEDVESCVAAGITPSDALPSERFHLSSHPMGDARNAQARRNLNLTLSQRNLAIEEVALTLQILHSRANRRTEDFRLYVLALIIAVKGFPIAEAQNIEVFSGPRREVRNVAIVLNPQTANYSEWLLPAVPIPYRQQHGAYVGCHTVRNTLLMSDNWSIGRLVGRLIEIDYPDWRGESVQPFKDLPNGGVLSKSYPERLSEALRSSSSDRGPGLSSRVTFARLSRTISQRIYDQTGGDLAVVTYATMHVDPTGEDSRFYATPSIRRIQQATHRAESSLYDQLSKVFHDLTFDTNLLPSDQTGYVGSPMCPTLEALAKYLEDLIELLRQLRMAPGKEPARKRHNAFVLLTFCICSLGTCRRPTNGLLPAIESIDISSGLTSTVDKGAAKARFGVIAPVALAQLEAFFAFVDGTDFEAEFGQRPSSKLFFISPVGEYVPLSPSALVQQGLPFVPNFARHYVKSQFDEWCERSDLHLSQESIAILLGHFFEGQEPFGPHSSHDYEAFATHTRSALNALLADLVESAVDINGNPIRHDEFHI